MKRPVIGVNTDVAFHEDGTMLHALRAPYAEAVRRAGGRPLLLPAGGPESVDEDLAGLDGLLMIGGDDMAPERYGARERHPEEVPLHPLREEYDLALLRAAVAAGTPLFGVCLGLQELAAAYGGAIHQFIADSVPEAVPHRAPDRTPVRHEIATAEGTFLREIMGPSGTVNSMHRQAVAAAGKGQIVSGRAPDGVIEAIEGPGAGFVLGVQWHPELMIDEPGQLALFEALVRAAAGRIM
jgi:putative glutamine amidotransferase